MRFYRISFVGGLAVGYVLGTQAGRERYEQLKQLASKAAESPAMQQTAGALQAQATATAKSARSKATTGVRKSASKVTKRAARRRAARHREAQVEASRVQHRRSPATGRCHARRAVMTTALSFRLTAASATPD